MKTSRNSICPCGSGKKYKRCCGPLANNTSSPKKIKTDRQWVEQNIIKDEPLFLYGRLQEELHDIPHEAFWHQLRFCAEPYLNGDKNRARAMQHHVDNQIDSLIARDSRFGYPKPFCHKGCANCCHEIVYCTDEEAEQIIQFCTENQLAIDTQKIHRQLKYIEFDKQGDHTGNTTWHNQETEDQSCVFLDKADRCCTIWPVRPLVCRVHLAEETNDYCMPHNGKENPNARGINYVELSYLLSAVFMIHRSSIKKTMGQLLINNHKLTNT